MAGTIRIGGNTIATHAGSEGAGTVTLDSSTLTIGSNTTIQGAMNAGSLTSGVTFPAGMVIKEQAFDEVASINAGAGSASSGNTVSFTKLKSSSVSYIVYNWNGYIYKYPNAGSYVDHQMTWTPSGGSADYTDWRAFDLNLADGNYWPFNPQYYINSLNAGTHTFTMQTRWGGGTNNNGSLVTDTDGYIFIREVMI